MFTDEDCMTFSDKLLHLLMTLTEKKYFLISLWQKGLRIFSECPLVRLSVSIWKKRSIGSDVCPLHNLKSSIRPNIRAPFETGPPENRNQPESTGINRNQNQVYRNHTLNLRNQLPENRNQPESTSSVRQTHWYQPQSTSIMHKSNLDTFLNLFW